MKPILFAVMLALLAGGVSKGQSETDSFEQIKLEYASAPCLSMTFYSIVVSEIFETTDTVAGTALFAKNGRYLVQVGDDSYLDDLTERWSYSLPNNQVLIEPSDPDGASADQFLFITRLDELYNSTILSPDSLYLLRARDDMEGDYPDSMTVLVDAGRKELAELIYYDINEELNRIVLLKTEIKDACADSLFKLNLPDSVDVVRF
ncbi:MAG: hypothetical protein P1R58_07420 [bacterium]|nr:hypothetical protein [bacterium]